MSHIEVQRGQFAEVGGERPGDARQFVEKLREVSGGPALYIEMQAITSGPPPTLAGAAGA